MRGWHALVESACSFVGYRDWLRHCVHMFFYVTNTVLVPSTIRLGFGSQYTCINWNDQKHEQKERLTQCDYDTNNKILATQPQAYPLN